MALNYFGYFSGYVSLETFSTYSDSTFGLGRLPPNEPGTGNYIRFASSFLGSGSLKPTGYSVYWDDGSLNYYGRF